MNDIKINDIKGTITKLLALAESPNENEARAALLKARELMAKHKLMPEDVAGVQNTTVIRRLVGITCTKMTNTWAVSLAAVIAEHYCCKAYREHRHGAKKVEIGLIGLEDDFELCERVFKYAFDYVDAQCKKIRAENKREWTSTAIRQMTNSYGSGFCSGLLAAYKEQDREHQEWGLVLVTPKAVMDVVSDMGKPSGYKSVNSDSWQQFAAKGYKDGQNFDPESKKRLA